MDQPENWCMANITAKVNISWLLLSIDGPIPPYTLEHHAGKQPSYMLCKISYTK